MMKLDKFIEDKRVHVFYSSHRLINIRDSSDPYNKLTVWERSLKSGFGVDIKTQIKLCNRKAEMTNILRNQNPHPNCQETST